MLQCCLDSSRLDSVSSVYTTREKPAGCRVLAIQLNCKRPEGVEGTRGYEIRERGCNYPRPVIEVSVGVFRVHASALCRMGQCHSLTIVASMGAATDTRRSVGQYWGT